MKRRAGRREQSVFANPVLIGALAVLATIVAVGLAYQANNGLPFVPKYTLRVEIRDASELTHGAEVHMGGTLVGIVDRIDAARDASGLPIAVMDLKLNKTVEPLPVDSAFDVRLKGAIGLKYLQVIPGRSARTWEDGATVPLSHSSAEVDLDQVLSMFDPATRLGVRATTVGLSDALAGRGGDLNAAISAFVPLLSDLRPVMRNLAAPRTRLGGFFRGLENFSSPLAPVAQTQASLYVNLDSTFRALASVAVPFLQDWISQTPPTFSTAIAASPSQQAFLNDTAGLFAQLRQAFATLPSSAPVLADAFALGAQNLPGTATLDRRTVSLSQHLAGYSQNPIVQQGISRLTLTAKNLHPPLSFLTPVQSTCNYATLFLRNTASVLSEHTHSGTALRFLIVVIDDVLGGEAVPSSKVYMGVPSDPMAEHGPLHVNPYPNTASPGQTRECAAGNEPYSVSHAVIGDPPGNQGTKTQTTSRSGK